MQNTNVTVSLTEEEHATIAQEAEDRGATTEAFITAYLRSWAQSLQMTRAEQEGKETMAAMKTASPGVRNQVRALLNLPERPR